MKRILFVDDEPNILDGLQDLLRKYRHHMAMVFVTSGERALAELENGPFDVVVSDMRMPGMDGAAFFQKVKESYPDVIRIILSGHADRGAIFRALPVSHQFLAKPCDAVTLCDAIERSCKLREVLADQSLEKKIGGIEKLPSLPEVYWELMDAMSTPDASSSQIAAIIERDSAMSMKLLQLVNSACFGSTKAIARIDHAVVYLGTELVRNLALTVHVFTTLAERSPIERASLESLQQHAVLTARIAKQLLSGEQSQAAFTASLLHDVGRIVLSLCIPDEYKLVTETALSESRPLQAVESEILGVNHAAVGAYLLGLWGLPFPIVEAVAHHHNPAGVREATFGVSAATALADSMVDVLKGETSSIDASHLESMNVLGDLPRFMAIAEKETNVVPS